MAEKPPERYLQRGAQYLLEDFMQIVRLGRHAIRAARRNGFRVLRAHGRVYVNSDDWFEHLERLTRGPRCSQSD
jgi:hypothetical protein